MLADPRWWKSRLVMEILVCGIPAMAADDPALVAMLDGLTSNMQQAFGLLVAILINMKVQVQVPLFGKLEDPAIASLHSWLHMSCQLRHA